MQIEHLQKDNQHLLLKCISGSRAYGLETPQSDTDYKGIFVLPKKLFYGLNYTDQVNNETNDIVYYELKKFLDLLLKNNPNILELLATPKDCILYRHPLMDLIKPEDFLSQLCCQTFAGYAQAQIKKARGLNKKISNPVEPERKTIADFCYILADLGAVPLTSWLSEKAFALNECGLVKIPHMRDLYGLFHNSQLETGYLKGIYSDIESNDVSLSSVPKNILPLAFMSFNKDAYSIHCKEFAQYWEWIEKRNEVRYENAIAVGKNYDTKNMMHTFRLLNMAEEIAIHGEIFVRRNDRAFLMDIRQGNFEYDYLVEMATEKIQTIKELFDKSSLKQEPDPKKTEDLLSEMRETFYSLNGR